MSLPNAPRYRFSSPFFQLKIPLRFLFAFKYLGIQTLAVWTATYMAPDERRIAERSPGKIARERFWTRTDILLITGAVVVLGAILSLVRIDWRKLFASLVLGTLLLAGIAFR